MASVPGTPRWRLIEVWNDTVDVRHLAWAIVIGIVISVASFLAASRLLRGAVESAQLAHAYAMLAGLAGCVIAGALCARLFEPKRRIVEDGQPADPAWWREVLADLNAGGGLGTEGDLPPAAVAELKELELYDLFAKAQAEAGRRS